MADPFAPVKQSPAFHVAQVSTRGAGRAAVLGAIVGIALFAAFCILANNPLTALGFAFADSGFLAYLVAAAGAAVAGALTGALAGAALGAKAARDEQTDIKLGVIECNTPHLKHLERGFAREKAKQAQEEREGQLALAKETEKEQGQAATERAPDGQQPLKDNGNGARHSEEQRTGDDERRETAPRKEPPPDDRHAAPRERRADDRDHREQPPAAEDRGGREEEGRRPQPQEQRQPPERLPQPQQQQWAEARDGAGYSRPEPDPQYAAYAARVPMPQERRVYAEPAPDGYRERLRDDRFAPPPQELSQRR